MDLYNYQNLNSQSFSNDVLNVGEFLDNYPLRHPIYLAIKDSNNLILLSGQTDIIEKVKNYRFITYREIDAEIHRASINLLPAVSIHNHIIKICVIIAIPDNNKQIF